MFNTWNLVVINKNKEKILESFSSLIEGTTALKYRKILWHHLGSDPRFSYVLQKVISK
tara:strand:+ start:171 stop:344 length:174 start_codon:yes stop_codon:yes gene_type:complete